MQEEEFTIPEMVDEMREGKLQRRQFIKQLTIMGVSAAGIGAIVAAAASRRFATSPVSNSNGNDVLSQKHLHEQHLAHQSQGNIDHLYHDYAEHAVVEDSMYPQPFVGRTAIMSRKSVGMQAIPGLKINVTNRIEYGNRLTVEWVAT